MLIRAKSQDRGAPEMFANVQRAERSISLKTLLEAGDFLLEERRSVKLPALKNEGRLYVTAQARTCFRPSLHLGFDEFRRVRFESTSILGTRLLQA